MNTSRQFENARWSDTDQSLTYRHRAGINQLHVTPDITTSSQIIDIGCGDGTFLEQLANEGYDSTVGIDFSEVGVKRTRKKGFEAELVDVENETLPFDDDAFDVAMMLDVLEHLYRPRPALREVTRVANRVIIVTPNFNNLKARYRAVTGRTPPQNKPEKGHVFWVNRQTLHDLLSDVDLDIEVEDFYIYKQDTWLRPLVRAIGTRFPEIFATAFTVRCRSM